MKPHKGPQAANFPANFFNTWLEYRLSGKISQADLIREINEITGRVYDNAIIYKWKKQQKTLPPLIYNKIINKDMHKVLRYVFNQQGIPTKGVNFKKLAKVLSAPVILMDEES